MKLLIADDHPIVLDGLQALLRGTGFIVVARCHDGDEVLAALPRHAPDILVLDKHMPQVGGLEILRRVKAEGLSVKTVLLAASVSDRGLLEALRLGVDGLALKRTASSRLLECLEAVRSGRRWLDPEAMACLMQAVDRMPTAPVPEASLTARELEVARLVTLGLRNKQIAYELAVSEATVKMHLHLMYQKLGLGSRTELALFARTRGIS